MATTFTPPKACPHREMGICPECVTEWTELGILDEGTVICEECHRSDVDVRCINVGWLTISLCEECADALSSRIVEEWDAAESCGLLDLEG